MMPETRAGGISKVVKIDNGHKINFLDEGNGISINYEQGCGLHNCLSFKTNQAEFLRSVHFTMLKLNLTFLKMKKIKVLPL